MAAPRRPPAKVALFVAAIAFEAVVVYLTVAERTGSVAGSVLVAALVTAAVSAVAVLWWRAAPAKPPA